MWTSLAPRRSFSLTSAPGHRASINNMIAGESQADVALTMVSADGKFTTENAKGNHKAEELQRQTWKHWRLINLMKMMQIYIGVDKTENVRDLSL